MTNSNSPDVEQEQVKFARWFDSHVATFEERHHYDIRENESSYWIGWQAARQHSATQLAALTEKLAAAEAREAKLRTFLHGRHDAMLDQLVGAVQDRTALDTTLAEARREAVAEHAEWCDRQAASDWHGRTAGDMARKHANELQALPNTPQAASNP